jgi:hypothetical protein
MAYNDEKEFLDLAEDIPLTDRDNQEYKLTESNIDKFKKMLSKKDTEAQFKYNQNSSAQTGTLKPIKGNDVFDINALDMDVNSNNDIKDPSKENLLLLSNNSATQSNNKKSSSSSSSSSSGSSSSRSSYIKQQKPLNIISADKDAHTKNISVGGLIHSNENIQNINEINPEKVARLETAEVRFDNDFQKQDTEFKTDVITNLETEARDTLIKKPSSGVGKKKASVTFNNPVEEFVNTMMVKETSNTISKHLLRKAGSKEGQSEEAKFINSIIQKEVCLPDDVLVSELFRDFKLMEFITALFTLISNSYINIALFSAICYYEVKVNFDLSPSEYNEKGVENGKFATLIIMNISNFLFCKIYIY